MMKKPMTILGRERGECMQLVRILAQLDCAMLRGSIRKGVRTKDGDDLEDLDNANGRTQWEKNKGGCEEDTDPAK
jgi:hypothetical protein